MRRPDLIVPIHDRRKGKRYLTLKNFGIVMLVCFLAFVGITMHSEMRDHGPAAYARYERKPTAPPKPAPIEVVQEEPPPATLDSSFYIEPPPVTPTVTEYTPPPVTDATTGGDVKVVGGPEGVTIVRQDRRRPVLAGGFGRE